MLSPTQSVGGHKWPSNAIKYSIATKQNKNASKPLFLQVNADHFVMYLRHEGNQTSTESTQVFKSYAYIISLFFQKYLTRTAAFAELHETKTRIRSINKNTMSPTQCCVRGQKDPAMQRITLRQIRSKFKCQPTTVAYLMKKFTCIFRSAGHLSTVVRKMWLLKIINQLN